MRCSTAVAPPDALPYAERAWSFYEEAAVDVERKAYAAYVLARLLHRPEAPPETKARAVALARRALELDDESGARQWLAERGVALD